MLHTQETWSEKYEVESIRPWLREDGSEVYDLFIVRWNGTDHVFSGDEIPLRSGLWVSTVIRFEWDEGVGR